MPLKNSTMLWLFTLGYFLLVFMNIHLALLAMLCMTLPFVLLWRDRRKTWCQSYCPRASFLSRFSLGKRQANKPVPTWLLSSKTRRWVVNYFFINLFFVVMSTIQVALGRMRPMLIPRFLILVPIPVQLPQLIEIAAPAWLTHLSFRLLSMMFTTTVIGLALAWLYRGRTWCAICPISTLSDQALAKGKKVKSN